MLTERALGRWRLLAMTLTIVCVAVGASAQQGPPATQASASASAGGGENPPPVELTLEPRAIEILKAACGRLAVARTLRFTAVVSYESPSRLGPPLVYTTTSDVTVRRPDRLRVITPGDGPASEFYFDGKRMMAFAPAENLVAVADAPATIDAALKVAYDSAAIYFPFTDLIVADPYQAVSEGLILAFYIGQSSVVGDTVTDMVAFANDDVFVQAWIGAQDHLPRRLRAVYRADPAHLRHDMHLSGWQLDGAVAEDAFASARAAGARPIAFRHPNPRPPAAATPPGGSLPASGGSK